MRQPRFVARSLFTKGRIIVRGKLVTRGKAKRADYVLYYQHFPIAMIEAKDNICAVGGGMQQALDYALTLDIPFVFSSNGDGFVFHDRTGLSAQRETTLQLEAFPGPTDLWAKYRAWKGLAAEPEKIRVLLSLQPKRGSPRTATLLVIEAACDGKSPPARRVRLPLADRQKTYLIADPG